MTVRELIAKLKECPFPDAQVAFQSGDSNDPEPEGLLEVQWYQDGADLVWLQGDSL